MQPLLSYNQYPGRIIQQPVSLSLEGYPGNAFVVLLQFEIAVPNDLAVTVCKAVGQPAESALAPTLTTVSATESRLTFSGAQMTALLNLPHYLTLSWGGQVQAAGEVVAKPHTQILRNPGQIDLRNQSGVTVLVNGSELAPLELSVTSVGQTVWNLGGSETRRTVHLGGLLLNEGEHYTIALPLLTLHIGVVLTTNDKLILT